jgi:hypothetical protein
MEQTTPATSRPSLNPRGNSIQRLKHFESFARKITRLLALGRFVSSGVKNVSLVAFNAAVTYVLLQQHALAKVRYGSPPCSQFGMKTYILSQLCLLAMFAVSFEPM